MSVVYYVPTDDDELLVSTMAGRSKAIAVARDPKVSLCVLDERWPFTYLQVYADATVDPDPELVVDVMMAVGERMSGQPLGAEARPAVEAMAEQEGRVVLRCRPYATFATPPGTCTAVARPPSSRTWSRGASRGTHPTPPDPQAGRAFRAIRASTEYPGIARAFRHATRVQHHSRRHLSNIGLHRIRVRGVPGSRHLGREGCRQALFAAARALLRGSLRNRSSRPAGRDASSQSPAKDGGDRALGTVVRAVAARRPTWAIPPSQTTE